MTNKILEDYLNSIEEFNSIEDLKSLIKKDIVWTEYNRTKGGMIAGYHRYDITLEHPIGFKVTIYNQKRLANTRLELLELFDNFLNRLIDINSK